MDNMSTMEHVATLSGRALVEKRRGKWSARKTLDLYGIDERVMEVVINLFMHLIGGPPVKPSDLVELYGEITTSLFHDANGDPPTFYDTPISEASDAIPIEAIPVSCEVILRRYKNKKPQIILTGQGPTHIAAFCMALFVIYSYYIQECDAEDKFTGGRDGEMTTFGEFNPSPAPFGNQIARD